LSQKKKERDNLGGDNKCPLLKMRRNSTHCQQRCYQLHHIVIRKVFFDKNMQSGFLFKEKYRYIGKKKELQAPLFCVS